MQEHNPMWKKKIKYISDSFMRNADFTESLNQVQFVRRITQVVETVCHGIDVNLQNNLQQVTFEGTTEVTRRFTCEAEGKISMIEQDMTSLEHLAQKHLHLQGEVHPQKWCCPAGREHHSPLGSCCQPCLSQGQ